MAVCTGKLSKFKEKPPLLYLPIKNSSFFLYNSAPVNFSVDPFLKSLLYTVASLYPDLIQPENIINTLKAKTSFVYLKIEYCFNIFYIKILDNTSLLLVTFLHASD